MNRRKALKQIFFGSLGGMALVSGYEWSELKKTADIKYLESHKALIDALADTIIPTTDIPGAKEAAVGDFILIMIKDCTEPKAQSKFIDGLKNLESYCKWKYRKYFENCSYEERLAILNYVEKKDRPFAGIIGKAQTKFLGKSFTTTLKEYTAEGYCTSEAGATRGLTYVPVPGSYKGCMQMLPGQTAWATN